VALEGIENLTRQIGIEILRHAQPSCQYAECALSPRLGKRPNRATGLPDFAMMISSPAAAASTKRESWVFAA
jgi:hypothetical protein